jgi:hypothetical protein
MFSISKLIFQNKLSWMINIQVKMSFGETLKVFMVVSKTFFISQRSFWNQIKRKSLCKVYLNFINKSTNTKAKKMRSHFWDYISDRNYKELKLSFWTFKVCCLTKTFEFVDWVSKCDESFLTKQTLKQRRSELKRQFSVNTFLEVFRVDPKIEPFWEILVL